MCFFAACGSKEEDKTKSAYSSSVTEEKKGGLPPSVKEFIRNNPVLVMIVTLAFTVVNWKIWNSLVDIEFFSSIIDHYARKAAICFFIGMLEAGIVLLILYYVLRVLGIFLIIALIGAGIYGIYYKFGDTIKEKFNVTNDKKDVIQNSDNVIQNPDDDFLG